MTILAEHPWLILLYIVSAALQLAVTLLPRLAFPGWVNALYHGIAVTGFFLTGAALEDVLLFLLFSCTVGLALALFLPDKRETAAQDKTVPDDADKEGEETK